MSTPDSRPEDQHRPVRLPVEGPVPPPTPHQQAFLAWVAVLPSLTMLQLLLGGLLRHLPVLARPPIMATLVVPIMVYLAMPRLLRIRAHLIRRRSRKEINR